MTYEEVCSKAHKFIEEAGGRTKLTELVYDMDKMERATFVQAISAQLDFITCCICNVAEVKKEQINCTKESHDALLS